MHPLYLLVISDPMYWRWLVEHDLRWWILLWSCWQIRASRKRTGASETPVHTAHGAAAKALSICRVMCVPWALQNNCSLLWTAVILSLACFFSNVTRWLWANDKKNLLLLSVSGSGPCTYSHRTALLQPELSRGYALSDWSSNNRSNRGFGAGPPFPCRCSTLSYDPRKCSRWTHVYSAPRAPDH